jgi:small conductance mechanosensitive channel
MKNSTAEQYRRVDLEFQFAYGSDVDEVRQAIAEVISANPLVLQGPVDDSENVSAPWMGISKLGDSGVTILTRSWCKGTDYWPVYFGLNETVYQTLKTKGFMFPFNRMDVNILSK